MGNPGQLVPPTLSTWTSQFASEEKVMSELYRKMGYCPIIYTYVLLGVVRQLQVLGSTSTIAIEAKAHGFGFASVVLLQSVPPSGVVKLLIQLQLSPPVQ